MEQIKLDTQLFIGGYGYNLLGERVSYQPVLEKELATKLAKRNHRRCNGTGVLTFDNGIRENDRDSGINVRYNQWQMACDCVKKKLISIGKYITERNNDR